MPYRHLTLEERRTLFRPLNAKVPVAAIARHRAIRRNFFHEQRGYAGYFPLTAHDLSRQRRRRRRRPIKSDALRRHVVEKLEACRSVAAADRRAAKA